MPGPIGVLLPLRIETVFDQPANLGGDWRLRVLLVPDEASLDRHTGARPAELALLRTMWATAAGNLTSPQGRNAFSRLANGVGPARAAWLVRSFPPQRDGSGKLRLGPSGDVVLDETALTQDDASISPIAGIPRRIELWFARGDETPLERLAVLGITPEALTPQGFDLDQPHWLWDWDAATGVGLGATINLRDVSVNDPAEIAVLIAVGLGDEPAIDLFQRHRETGRLSFVKPGTPTNSITGSPTVDWGGDLDAWLQRALNPTSSRSCDEFANLLGGAGGALAGMPDPAGEHQRLNLAMVQSLWYALWGHGLKDVWGLAHTHEAGVWAGEHVFPEGPLPPVRIGDQPYGVLPATSLARWTSDPADVAPHFAQVETAMISSLSSLRRLLASTARAAGNVVGADSERLLQLLARTPITEAFAYRAFLPLPSLWTLLKLFGSTMTLAEIFDFWEHESRDVLKFPVNPPRAYGTIGWPLDLELPLVDPRHPPFHHALEELLSKLDQQGPEAFAADHAERKQPNSLLLRLWMYSALLADAELTRAAAGTTLPLVEPMVSTDPQSELWKAVFATDPTVAEAPGIQGSPQLTLYRAIWNVRRLLKQDVPDIERVFCATLDCAGRRVDPWVTGVAWRRLRSLREQGVESVLGVYSWVDRPFTGTRGPTSGGLLHAPTHEQAQAAIVLRDKAVHDFQAGRWKMNLTSETVRLAKRLADQVREGSHLAEVLGREMEGIASDRDLIASLRAKYPIRVEHEGRRVCDGMKVLDEPVLAQLGFNARQLEEVDRLRAALDAYADMLVADGIHHLVTGNAERAAKTMDAAAGLALPPEMDVMKTRRAGWSVTSTTIQVLRDDEAPDPTVVGVSAGELAEPAVAAFLGDWLGGPSTESWSWRFERGGSKVDVHLAQAGLAPVDALVLDPQALELLLQEQLPDAGVGWILTDPRGRASRDRARILVGAMARQPALSRDIFPDGKPEDVGAADEAALVELRDRYNRLLGAASLLVATSEVLIAVGAGGDEAARRTCLRHFARWGIAPTTLEGETVLDRLSRARAALVDRVSAAPNTTLIASLGAAELASAISELAAPGGRLRVFARMPLQALIHRGLVPAPLFRRTWLETIAAVRMPLARVESVWLAEGEHRPLLTIYSDHPSDPWQQQVIARNEERARLGKDTPAPPPLTVALAFSKGLDGLDPSDLVAVGILDSWGETVPRRRHETTAALGFNAPAARPPQALLIAAPPRVDVPLDAETLADIVMETRALAHARMVSPDDAASLAQALPITFVSAAGHAGVSLEANP